MQRSALLSSVQAATALALTFVFCAVAQETTDQPPESNVHVLETQRVELGDRAIIYQRITPPAPPTPIIPAPSDAAPTVELRGKTEKHFGLSATVYDLQLTKLRWFVDGHEYWALSNVDFNYLAGLGTFETATTVYSLVMGLGNESAKTDAALTRLAAQHGFAPPATDAAPARGNLHPERAEFRLLSEGVAPAEALAPIQALHAYFQTHRERLIREYHQRQADNRAREQRLRDHPPAPQDAVIQFWPGKGTFHFPGK